MLNARWKPTTPQGLKGRRRLERRQWSHNNGGSAWKKEREGEKRRSGFVKLGTARWKETIPVATSRVARRTSLRNSTITASCWYRSWKPLSKCVIKHLVIFQLSLNTLDLLHNRLAWLLRSLTSHLGLIGVLRTACQRSCLIMWFQMHWHSCYLSTTTVPLKGRSWTQSIKEHSDSKV